MNFNSLNHTEITLIQNHYSLHALFEYLLQGNNNRVV